ncbi:Synaptotagmin beta [Strongyloides ratti]|uniref:Synaptotagmin beta n=1 Tax=Strongyloides ratti TaxID=34506 RepID=A0A090KZK8_STRRB|nr:Synaptotagmin beta [Strongyloides ratti]CEF62861.1 Synaptotagmin beta [Strongyloides ratti]
MDFQFFDDPLTDNTIFLLVMIGGTMFLVTIIMGYIILQKRKQNFVLNWYENNLLEMSTSKPIYGSNNKIQNKIKTIKYKNIRRMDTEDESVSHSSPIMIPSKESKCSGISKVIVGDRRKSIIKNITSDLDNKDYLLNLNNSDNNVDRKNLSGLFVVPKLNKPHTSLFEGISQNQIDRGLYKTSFGDMESCYDEEQTSGGCCGSIKISMFLDSTLNLFTIILKQANELISKRTEELPNPYFKISLEVPESKEGKVTHTSKVYKNTNNPEINQEFFFQIPSNVDITQCRLEILVYDYDQFSVDEGIGYIWLTLGRLGITQFTDKPLCFWAEVLPIEEGAGNEYGEVLLSFSYLSKAQRLTVNVFKGRNLSISSNESQVSTSIRISLLHLEGEKRLKRKKTSSKKNTSNPQFNESLNFNVPKNSLCDMLLEVEAVTEYGTFGMSHKIIGKINIPLHKCKDLWRGIIHEQKCQARWYQLERA